MYFFFFCAFGTFFLFPTQLFKSKLSSSGVGVYPTFWSIASIASTIRKQIHVTSVLSSILLSLCYTFLCPHAALLLQWQEYTWKTSPSKLRQLASDRALCHLSHLLHSCVHLVSAIAHCRLQHKSTWSGKTGSVNYLGCCVNTKEGSGRGEEWGKSRGFAGYMYTWASRNIGKWKPKLC